ncbi:UDP-N-acetylglucosamine 2-epimerase (non-hydrolyzing) [Bradyrhizobium guangzhouense]|uniref:UDP-N-acetylglucosamine 2-epimerase (non-hydrolyzing) n=1 Tax=Bradyrhizobium guangzhouense TaxID=1325095 RepID=A0ABY0E0B5_9BRAD|nr:UDP-N-acetylglucosamine 2-epimerase (non-hydrolyzing) [Bradyrhizobium guangzhouense]RXH09188.1 UDP-N-acetylglucosamine 2-epimerase (non-hydrolyzing) [Bradyrhizobium guangzhouense]
MKLLICFGTRPEALKLFPVVGAAKSFEPNLLTKICVTGQHRQMLDQVLSLTGLRPDFDLDLMSDGQSLAEITSRALTGITQVIEGARPDFIVVQGDTTSAMAVAMAAFYKKIRVAHVEAGLRSGNLHSPWPEEANRKIVGTLADIHFAPTPRAQENLLREGVPAKKILITGNTVVDTLMHFSAMIDRETSLSKTLATSFPFLRDSSKVILVTAHRRENFDGGIEQICDALELLARRDDVQIVYPTHLNPKVLDVVRRRLGATEQIHLLPPQEYLPFVYLMKRSFLILTDSGGVQEEAPSLGKPVLVMRDNTERPEGVEAGTARLVGARRDAIVAGASLLLDDAEAYSDMTRRHNPYGDGQASKRIIEALVNHA